MLSGSLYLEDRKNEDNRSMLDMFMEIPQETYALIDHSFLNDKMKRTYKRVIEERKTRFIRQSE